jgi:hypothetical protein
MKWFTLIPVLVIAFVVNACEKHPASDAPEEGVTAFGEHAKGHEEKAESRPEDQPASAKEKPAAATPEAKPGEAPKFFSEKK